MSVTEETMTPKTILQRRTEREFAFEDRDFRFLAGLANKRTGIVLSENKRDMIYARLARRLRALNLSSFTEYCELLQSTEGEDEIGQLVNAVTTNLTSFFRERHHFQHLRETVLPEAQGKHVRIWSAGCSSGMEPYSIAMTLHDALPDLRQWDARILATDIDSYMLEVAMRGEYAGAEYEHLPASCKHFAQYNAQANTMQVNDTIRNSASFRQLNLLDAWPMKGKFDAVFCRNVVIYFDTETKKKLFARMAELIKPNGWLYIGHSENLHNISDRFTLMGRTIYRRDAQ